MVIMKKYIQINVFNLDILMRFMSLIEQYRKLDLFNYYKVNYQIDQQPSMIKLGPLKASKRKLKELKEKQKSWVLDCINEGKSKMKPYSAVKDKFLKYFVVRVPKKKSPAHTSHQSQMMTSSQFNNFLLTKKKKLLESQSQYQRDIQNTERQAYVKSLSGGQKNTSKANLNKENISYTQAQQKQFPTQGKKRYQNNYNSPKKQALKQKTINIDKFDCPQTKKLSENKKLIQTKNQKKEQKQCQIKIKINSIEFQIEHKQQKPKNVPKSKVEINDENQEYIPDDQQEYNFKPYQIPDVQQ